MFDTERVVGGEGGGQFVRAEIVLAHRRHVRGGVAHPRAHRVRVGLGVLLYRARCSTVGVSFAQYRVDGRALDLVVAGLVGGLLVVLWILDVVGKVIALCLEFFDRGAQLRNRCADVWQLDDVRGRRLGQLAELGEVVGDLLVVGETLREGGDDSGGQRNVSGVDLDSRDTGVGLHDWQERQRGEGRGLVGPGVHDRRFFAHELRNASVCRDWGRHGFARGRAIQCPLRVATTTTACP